MTNLIELAKPWIADLAVYEPGRPIDEVARELGFEGADAVDKLASNENPLGPSPKAIRAMKKSAAKMHLYPDGGGYYLRHALAARLNVSPDQLLLGNGSNEILEFLGHVFLGPDTNLVMADRAFVVYRLIARSFQADVIDVPMINQTHDLDAMLDAITPQTRLVMVSNPNNPSGTMVSQRAIDKFMARIPKHVIVCMDEAYIELLPPKRQVDTLRYLHDDHHIVILRTFSKTYGLAGLRIGYAIAPQELIDLMHRVRQPFNVNAMAMEAALAALDDEAHVRRTRRLVSAGLAYFTKAFEAMNLSYVPSISNFILVRVGNGRAVFEALQRHKVIVRPMEAYRLPEYVRISVGTMEENQRCIKALEAVLNSSE